MDDGDDDGIECKWSTCTARFGSSDELLPHISTLHLTANHMGRLVAAAMAEAEQHEQRRRPAATAATITTTWTAPQTETSPEAAGPAVDRTHITATSSDAAASEPSSRSAKSKQRPHAHTDNGSSGRRDVVLVCRWNACDLPTFSDVDDLIRHLSVEHLPLDEHMQSRPHRCRWSQCEQLFSTFEDLTGHLSETHVGYGKSTYVCEWDACPRAGRPFAQRPKVMRHVQTHTGDKPFQCMLCMQRFSEQAVMAQHLRTHTGEKPYACPEVSCLKQFTVPGALVVHLRKHTGERPFRCRIEGCNRRFSDSSNLTKHVRVHTGERPFRCPMDACDKAFARPDQAARHVRVHRPAESDAGATHLPPADPSHLAPSS